MKLKIALVAACAAVLLSAPVVRAIDITIYDNNSDGNATGPYGRAENNEVEPFISFSPALQIWDLEKFDLSGSTLTLQSGYNLTVGEGGGLSHIYRPGDLFFSSTGNAIFGVGAPFVGGGNNIVTPNVWGYNYVVNFGRNADGSLNGTYSVLAIDATTKVWDVTFDAMDPSNPWKYASGAVRTVSTGNAYGLSTFSDVEGLHYNLSVDVSWLTSASSDFLVHYTYECGNDSIIGKVHVPDGGMTVVLLGFGLVAMGFLRRMSH